MRFLRFRQRHFRNLQSPELRLPPGLTAIVGPNASGKTSLLEALYLASGGELRGSASECIAFGAREAWLWIEIEGELDHLTIEQRLGEGRSLWINGAAASFKELAAYPGAVWLRPEDLFIVKGGPSERRRFLDQLIARFSPRYRALTSAYERALRQRNAALKLGNMDLAPWNDRLASYGAEIITLRRRLLKKLAPLAQAAHRQFAPGTLNLSLAETASPETLASALTSRLDEERARGVTLSGPHRDDLRITLDDRDATHFASRGEARTLALVLRIAEHRLLAEHHGEAPVLLLDDVVAELDRHRQDALIRYVRSLPQAVITGTEVPDGIGHTIELVAGVWEVTAGA